MRVKDFVSSSIEKDLTDLLSENTKLSKMTIKQVNKLLIKKYHLVECKKVRDCAFTTWYVDDVHCTMEDDDSFPRDLTEAEANGVLDKFVGEHDGEYGLTWDGLRDSIHEYCEENNIQCEEDEE